MYDTLTPIIDDDLCPRNIAMAPHQLGSHYYWPVDLPLREKEEIAHVLSRQSLFDQLKLYQLQVVQIPVNYLQGISAMTDRYHHSQQQQSSEKYNGVINAGIVGGALTSEIAMQGTERYQKLVESFSTSLNKLNDIQLKAITENMRKSEMTAAIKPALDEVRGHLYNGGAVNFLDSSRKKYLRSSKRIWHSMRINHISINSVGDALRLNRLASISKGIGVGGMVVGGISGGAEVIQAYRNHEEVAKVTAGVTAEFSVIKYSGKMGAIAGEFVTTGLIELGLISNPVGWTIIAASGIAGGLAACGLGKLIKNLVEKI